VRQLPNTLFLLLLVCIFGLGGCATIQTMPSLGTYEHPKIYSGTRLDLYAISKNEEALYKFKAKAPEHPLIDIPFSALLDTVLLPVTFPIANYEFWFGR